MALTLRAITILATAMDIARRAITDPTGITRRDTIAQAICLSATIIAERAFRSRSAAGKSLSGVKRARLRARFFMRQAQQQVKLRSIKDIRANQFELISLVSNRNKGTNQPRRAHL